ncbi:UDP-galactopyranose mutase, partial [bacterium]|nr:UDP-galactopyranose mutase [Candidatus Elulimicrobium humile]
MVFLVVGCGLSGATIAERIASQLNEKVIIIEKRDHIAGNCYDYYDTETGILMNKYGAHLFHTNNEIVWSYICKFAEWIRWEHKVLALVDSDSQVEDSLSKQFVSIPVNITTVNQLCGTNLQSSSDMEKWLSINQIHYPNGITNSEEMAKSRVGTVLYEKLFLPYTIKQWDKHPGELDASVLARIPVRGDFDTRY